MMLSQTTTKVHMCTNVAPECYFESELPPNTPVIGDLLVEVFQTLGLSRSLQVRVAWGPCSLRFANQSHLVWVLCAWAPTDPSILVSPEVSM
jgi:hypothetical protein